MNLLDYDAIRDFYNNHTNCWATDLFSQMTTSYIDKFVNKIIKSLNSNDVMLNAGSGGKCYDTIARQIHIDIAENTIKHIPNSYVGNIINMPFKDDFFDCIVCVGTVINYCEAEKAIKEFSRIAKKNAILILEYERLGSGFLADILDNADYTVFIHKYFEETHENLLYSDSYIYRLLSNNGFVIKKSKKFNVTIPWIERFLSENVAHKMVVFEKIFRLIPCINKYAHNEIVVCKKQW